MERPNAWKNYDDEALAMLEAVSVRYRDFLDHGKTERECVTETVAAAQKAGYVDLEQAIAQQRALKPGDKVYVNCMGKAVMLFHLGEEPLEKGVNIVGAHIDSPRIDIKQNPFYEADDIAYADTHYYGGIKKYQWVARAMALHGVVAKKDGTLVNIVVGEDENDPVVGISDLLIHLSADQMSKKASEVVGGEDLDIILCGRPLQGEEKEPVKALLLKLLKERYDIEEEDMLSAEIEAVPAGKTRDFGLDRSMLLGYGHDDRVCAYASLEAILTLTAVPRYTCCCLLADKEEIGSVGATGMRAHYFENAMAELIALTTPAYSELTLRRALRACRMLSCDVSAGFDPLYASAFEKKNAALMGHGVCYNKFTGSRGKSGSNDANAGVIGRLRKQTLQTAAVALMALLMVPLSLLPSFPVYLGLYALLERLVTAFPDVLFESCSGGGGRFDAGMLYYMPQTWTSDNSDAIERLKIQYGTSLVYPLSAMSAHVSASPNHQTGHVTDFATRLTVALTGSFGYELDPTAISEDERQAIRESAALFKELGAVLAEGDYHRLISPYDSDCAAWSVVSPDKRVCIAGFVLTHVRLYGPNQRLPLRGLDPDADYKERFSGRLFSGRELMGFGVDVHLAHEYKSALWVFEKI